MCSTPPRLIPFYKGGVRIHLYNDSVPCSLWGVNADLHLMFSTSGRKLVVQQLCSTRIVLWNANPPSDTALLSSSLCREDTSLVPKPEAMDVLKLSV